MRTLLALCCATCLCGADLALTGATVYPAPHAPPIRDGVVVVRGSRITAVGSRTAIVVSEDARVIDCSGNFIVAGLWNSHIHILTPELLRARDATAAVLDGELDTMLNRWGFTTVFDLASVLHNSVALRRRIESGEVRGPRIFTAGEPIWTKPPIYVRDYLAANRIHIARVTTRAEAIRAVRKLSGGGADGIKLFTGSMQGAGRTDNMPPEVVRAAVVEAHRRRLRVFAHPQNAAGLELAIAAGVDVLAHTAPESPPWTPDFIRRLTNARIALVPTLTLFDFEARKGGVPEIEREAWVRKMQDQLRSFSNAGGEVLFGTDVGYTDHYDTALEFAFMSRAGMSFAQILASLTTNPAARFGYSGRSGRIEKDMDADITVLKSDPAKDVRAFSEVRFTIRAGRTIYSSE